MARFNRLVCFLLVGAGLWAQSPVHLRTGDLRSAGRRPTASRLAHGGHYILGFPAYPDRNIRKGLTARGIHVLQYVPDSALMVSVPRGASLEGLNLTFAAAMEAGEKVDPALAASSTNAYLVIFHGDVAPERTREVARGADFDLVDHPSLLTNQLVTIGSFDRLRGLAANDEVQYIMPASPDLVAGTPLVACPGGITEAGPVGEYVLVGRGWSKDTTGAAAVQYFVQNVTEKVEANSAYAEVERAIREWTRFANITLTPTDRADALRTVAIRFAGGAHGDEYAFDGAGKTLAHTFYPAPPNSEPSAGDLHLDADEDWQVGGGIDIFSVVLHEMGHALGLGHSTQPGAVMYPYYRVATGLAADDIAGIQDLYGAPAAPSQAPTTPTGPGLQPPTTPAAPVTPTEPARAGGAAASASYNTDSSHHHTVHAGRSDSTAVTAPHGAYAAADNAGSATGYNADSGHAGSAANNHPDSSDHPHAVGASTGVSFGDERHHPAFPADHQPWYNHRFDIRGGDFHEWDSERWCGRSLCTMDRFHGRHGNRVRHNSLVGERATPRRH